MHILDAPSRPAPQVLDPQPEGKPQPVEQIPNAGAQADPVLGPAASALSLAAAAALAACGGGGGDDATKPSAEVSNQSTGSNNPGTAGNNPNTGSNPTGNNTGNNTAPPKAPPTETEAARFLMQASFGGTYAQVQEVQKKGFEKWLDDQLALPWDSADSHFQWLYDKGYFDSRTKNVQELGIDNTLWRKLMSAPDALRQRVAFAFSQIFVVGLAGLGAVTFRNVSVAAYMDLLEKNAFGTYADLLKAVSLSPAMGTYLNMKGSKAVEAGKNNQPDENFAREVMQLFSIGLYELNDDGTEKMPRKETYTQQDVTNIAAIFTGWDFASIDLKPTRTGTTGPEFPYNIPAPIDKESFSYFNQTMNHNSAAFTKGNKPFFNQTVSDSKSGKEAIYQVLDYLAGHANVGPFIGKQLIQRLVCSNPSPDYVKRVTQIFNNDGSGVRGNLKAVIKAILLDPEARNLPQAGTDAYNSYGKLREPVLRLAQWARTFNARSKTPDAKVNFIAPFIGSNFPNGPWQVGDLSDNVTGLGQAPFRSPSVFNFYRPGYVPTQGELRNKGIPAPEFQICNEVTVAKYLNLMNGIIDVGRNDVVPDYSADYELAKNAVALVDRYALLLAANGLSASTKKIISDAVANQATTNDDECAKRIKATIFMIMATPEYLIQK